MFALFPRHRISEGGRDEEILKMDKLNLAKSGVADEEEKEEEDEEKEEEETFDEMDYKYEDNSAIQYEKVSKVEASGHEKGANKFDLEIKPTANRPLKHISFSLPTQDVDEPPGKQDIEKKVRSQQNFAPVSSQPELQVFKADESHFYGSSDYAASPGDASDSEKKEEMTLVEGPLKEKGETEDDDDDDDDGEDYLSEATEYSEEMGHDIGWIYEKDRASVSHNFISFRHDFTALTTFLH
ncbi:unnamed protein product [Protopolystoma xenopodis]|uniref:Uncharacterized protein n=1 Tax=Protopolystoma xenopodis TaxID=117903 RepID=A0A3S5CBI0_9PLAT|nr:unnamed protein product [Protopolystoma xenopodis]